MIKAIIFDCYGVLANVTGNRAQPNEALFEYIETELHERFKLGILSNAARGTLPLIFTTEQLKFFDDKIVSGEVGLVKPQKEIFMLAAKRLGCEPAECVMVDDLEPYCLAAEEAGMSAIHYKDISDFKNNLKSILM